jgi:TRAP-type mannitol/chloroaromatic compound transport system permease large subunit
MITCAAAIDLFGVLVVRMASHDATRSTSTSTYARDIVRNISMADIFRGCGPFAFVDIMNVALFLAFPQFILLNQRGMSK